MVCVFVECEILLYVDEWERIGELFCGLYWFVGVVGLLGVGFFEVVGGGGGDGVDFVIICEEMYQVGVLGGVYVFLFICGIVVLYMVVFGDEWLIVMYVWFILVGEKIGVLVIIEFGGGFDVGYLWISVVWDGDYYVINGVKIYIIFGVWVDYVVIVV